MKPASATALSHPASPAQCSLPSAAASARCHGVPPPLQLGQNQCQFEVVLGCVLDSNTHLKPWERR